LHFDRIRMQDDPSPPVVLDHASCGERNSNSEQVGMVIGALCKALQGGRGQHAEATCLRALRAFADGILASRRQAGGSGLRNAIAGTANSPSRPSDRYVGTANRSCRSRAEGTSLPEI